jgi:threonine/homoserine/homoserine lactone efflux protein
MHCTTLVAGRRYSSPQWVKLPPMLSFSLSVLLLLITPGPGVLSTAGVGAAFGFRAGLRYVAGLCLGQNLVALIVASGLAAIVLATPWARNTLLVLSALYLLSIALRIALAGKRIAFIDSASIPGIRDALLLQIINPKAYAVNTTWLSGFALFPESLGFETLVKFIVINLVWIPIHLLWLYTGSAIHRLDLTPRTHFAINIGMALAMLAVVALAVVSAILGGGT